MDKLRDAETGMMWGMGGAASGLITATIAQLILCGPTGGTTCISAIPTTLVGGIAGLAKRTYHYIFDYIPQINILRDQYDAIEILRPKTDSYYYIEREKPDVK